MLKKIVKISSKLLLLERFMIVFFTISMIGLYGFNVLVREITPEYASSFAWIDEASRLLMVWVVFLSIGLAFDKGRHIAMTTFINQLKNIYFVYIGKIIDFSGFIFSSYCIWLAFNITVFVFNTGQISPTLNMPMYILYVAPTIGFTLLSIRYFLSLINFNNRFNISKHR